MSLTLLLRARDLPRSLARNEERARRLVELRGIESRLATPRMPLVSRYVAQHELSPLRTWFARRRGVTARPPSRIREPDASRSRQPLTTCVATALGGLAPLARGGTRGGDGVVGYVRPDSTSLVLTDRLEALGRRNRDSAAAPDSLRSAPEAAPLRTAPPAVCPMPPDSATSRTNLSSFPPPRATPPLQPPWVYRNCVRPVYIALIVHAAKQSLYQERYFNRLNYRYERSQHSLGVFLIRDDTFATTEREREKEKDFDSRRGDEFVDV